jgi:hypothetical protein
MDFTLVLQCVDMPIGRYSFLRILDDDISLNFLRWATIPVVKVAQYEKVVDFPHELDVPWSYLQRNFGVTAESGNNTANVLLNFNEKCERVYKINIGMSDLIRSSEEAFFRIFYSLEVLVGIQLSFCITGHCSFTDIMPRLFRYITTSFVQ